MYTGHSGSSNRTISAYSHAFFAMYIFFVLLEAYKGQTPGKHLLGIRVVEANGRKLTIIEPGIRNAGKLFLLPVDLTIGLALYYKKGYLRYTDYFIDVVTIEEKPWHQNQEARNRPRPPPLIT